MKFDQRPLEPACPPETVTAEQRSFAPLRGLRVKELLQRDGPGPAWAEHAHLVSDLLAVLRLTRQEMRRLNSQSPVIPPDSLHRMVDLLTRPSARVAMLYKRERAPGPGDSSFRRAIGFARVFQDREDFPDGDSIPEEILKEDVVRFDRFFVLDEGRIFDARGGAASRLFDKVIEIAGGRRILGKVLIGPSTIHPDWLVAKRALEQRGFEDTGHTELELFQHCGVTIPAEFRWYLYPPATGAGRARFQDVQNRIQQLQLPVRVRLAHTVGNIPLENALVLCYSMDPDAWDLAKVYPRNFVVGVASNTENRWRDERLPNLQVVKHGLFDSLLPEGSVRAVTSFGALPDVAAQGGRSRLENLGRFIAVQAAHLAPGGRLTLRDTYHPSDLARRVCMHLDRNPVGVEGSSYRARFERFLDLLADNDAARSVMRLFERPDGSTAYIVPYSLGNEFQLKAYFEKDMRREVRRPYTAYHLREIVESLEKNGFRVISASAEYNDYVLRRHRQGRVEFSDLDGVPLPQLPTNFRLVAEKIDPSQPVSIVPAGDPVRVRRGDFLEVRVCERIRSSWGRPEGELRSLVHRPNVTLDLIPYTRKGDDLFLLARVGFPRPVALEVGKLPDETYCSPFMNEEISVIVDPAGLENDDGVRRAAVHALGPRVGLTPADVRSFDPWTWYLPSGDITDEQIRVIPFQVDFPDSKTPLPASAVSGFSTDGSRQLVNARELLEGCAAGTITDARLARAAYDLLLRHGLRPGPWIGARLELDESLRPPPRVDKAESLLTRTGPAHFRQLPAEQDTFWDVYRREYVERFADGRSGRPVVREFARPAEQTGYSVHKLSVLPLIKHGGVVYAGIHCSPDVPASAQHGIGAEFPTVPDFNLPETALGRVAREDFATARVASLFGLRFKKLIPLGEAYLVSPGALPRFVYPYAGQVEEIAGSNIPLRYVPLHELLEARHHIHCGQLLTLTYRASHALQIFGEKDLGTLLAKE